MLIESFDANLGPTPDLEKKNREIGYFPLFWSAFERGDAFTETLEGIDSVIWYKCNHLIDNDRYRKTMPILPDLIDWNVDWHTFSSEVFVIEEVGNRSERRRLGNFVMFVIILIGFLIINMLLISPYVLAILMGMMLTVFVQPCYTYLRLRKFGPKSAAGIVILGLVLLVIAPLASFFSIAFRQAMAMGPELLQSGVFSIDPIVQKLTKFSPVVSVFGGADLLEDQVRDSLQKSAKFLTEWFIVEAGKFPNIFLQLILALLTCYFLLLDGKAFLTWLRDRVPLDQDVREELFRSFSDTSISVVWSTLAASLTQSALVFFTFLILGLPGPFLAGGATFILSWLPIVGSTPVWVGAMIYLYSQDQMVKFFVVIFAGFVTGLADNMVRPLVLKGRSDMHPLLSLIAIFGGLELFGIVGVFIGPMLAEILISLLRMWPTIGRRFGLFAKT